MAGRIVARAARALAAAFVWAALAMVLLAAVARAHDPDTHQVNDLADARNKIGGQCCDGKDYDVPLDWRRTDFGFKVKHSSGRWIDADAQTEVANKKRDGEARVWVYQDDIGDWHVRCFMPGVES